MAARASSPSVRRAIVTARASSSMAMVRARSWARSRVISASVAATSAVAKSPKPTVPSDRRTMRSKSMSEWVMPAAPSWRNSSQRPSTAPSGRSIVPGATGSPSGRTTSRASPLPALPATTSRGARTPARSVNRVMNPSCSTSWSRLSRAVRCRAAVPHQPPHRGEQLGIPGIAAVDLDRQRPDVVGGGEQHDARAVHRHRLELAGIDAELAQRPFDAGVRRAAAGRPDDEVHDRRRQQADRGRGDRPADRQRAEQHRADDRGADEPPAEVPERAGEVRRRHGDRRAGDGDCARRERGGTVEAHEPPGRAPGAAGDEHVQAEPASPPIAIPAAIEASSTVR